jgi:TPR repeat protein
MALVPALDYLLALQRGLLVLARRTRVITAATAVEVVLIGVVLAAGIGPLDLVGVTAAAAAILAGRVGGNLYLWARSSEGTPPGEITPGVISDPGATCGNHSRSDSRPAPRRARQALEARPQPNHTTGSPGGIMVRPARLIRISAAAATLALAGVWISGCSEASRMETRCMTGDVAVCIQLGDVYANGRGVARDLGRAARAYDRACAGGAVDVCNTLGEIVEQTGAVEGGIARAEQLYAKACEGGSSRGCLNLGLVAAGREDFVRAFLLYQKSCDGGWAAGCHQVAAAYQEGEGVAKDVIKALAVYTETCDSEYVESCTVAAGLYLAGAVVARNVEAALRLYGRALQVYIQSCKTGVDADCAEADKLRNRVTLLAAAQQQTQPPFPPPPGPDPIIK